MADATTEGTEPTRRRRATITDVAARANVSSATVSRVLNGNYPVAGPTRARVHAAVTELGYVVNAHARALAGTSNRTVGIIVHDVVDPFFAHIARGVERAASEAGRLCMVCCSHGDPRRELAFVDLLHEQRADAVVLVGGAHQDRAYAREVARRARSLHAGGARLVLCGRPSVGRDVPTLSVEYDNEGGAFALTDHLLTQGHERVLYLGGPPNLSTTHDRLAGHRRALALRGLPAAPELVHTGAFSPAFGHRRLAELLASGLEFSAVFAANDMVAIGALGAIEEAGLRVPDDISLVGYDDVPAAATLRPRLTTVHVPLEEMGRQAVRSAVPDAESDAWRPPVDGGVRLGTHIVVRDSVAARSPS